MPFKANCLVLYKHGSGRAATRHTLTDGAINCEEIILIRSIRTLLVPRVCLSELELALNWFLSIIKIQLSLKEEEEEEGLDGWMMKG